MDFKRSAGGLLVPAALAVGGIFHVDHMRDGELIDREEVGNLVVNQGLDHILNTVLNAGAQVPAWYLGIFEGNYTPTSGLTAATVTQTATESTAYNEGARQAYTGAASAGQSVTNSASKATFTINATKNIYGAFLVSAQAVSATTGVLLAAAKFAAAKAVVSGDQLLLTYTFNAASA
jgi:hypothetical protein